MDPRLACIGFGEAAAAFAGAWAGFDPPARAYDCKTTDLATRASKLADMRGADTLPCDSAKAAVSEADAVLCLVTADQALQAAAQTAGHMQPGALWFDMNSVSPDTKRRACRTIEAAGARYIDAAIMAPAIPARLAAPILLCGPHAQPGCALLQRIGFTQVTVLDEGIGAAAAAKLIRSVMIKGIEALSAECLLAADAAEVTDIVLNSLGKDWPEKLNYHLERMMLHGSRRAAEMQEAALMLESLGVSSDMTRAAAAAHHRIGALGIAPPETLIEKLALLPGKRTLADCST